MPLGAIRCSGVLRFPALCFVVFLRAVCSLLCGRVCCCSLQGFVLWLFWRVLLCVPCPLRSGRCCAALCWCACVALFVWSALFPALFPAPGAVVGCCVLFCCLWCAVARCWVLLSVVVFWWRVSVSVALFGRLACFPVVAVVCCGALLPCAVFVVAVLLCGTVLWCSAVFLRRCLFFLFLFSLENRSKTRKRNIFFPLFLFFF